MKNEQTKLFNQFNALMFTKRFHSLCDGIYALTGIEINDEKELLCLLANYNDPHRYYHNINHIISSLNYYDTIKHKISIGLERLVMQFAIYYHDIIYIPEKGDEFNIPESIRYAKNALANSKTTVGDSFSYAVAECIQATNHKYLINRPDKRKYLRPFESYMSDIDLKNLSLTYVEFDVNNNNIRQEFNMFSTEEFNKGQVEFLKSILSLDKIYLNPEFSFYENRARTNIESLIHKLSPIKQ